LHSHAGRIPFWTPDRGTRATLWIGSCLQGRLLKERCSAALYGERFERDRTEVPYRLRRLLPRERRR